MIEFSSGPASLVQSQRYEPECLVRPHFFCGQLLTDADLEAMVEWSRGHFRLARQRHGWGIVCGLAVSWEPDVSRGARVRIGPGYAVDSCGNDIVVCEEESFDLSDVCPKAGCFDPGSAGQQGARDRADKERNNGGNEEKGLFGQQLAGAQAVDLYLGYYERGAEPVSALRSRSCGQAECEDSRVREGHRVRVVANGGKPRAEWERWQRQYNERQRKVGEFVQWIQEANEPGSIGMALASWINAPERKPGQ